MAYDPSTKALWADARIGWLCSEVNRFASLAADRALYEADFGTALRYIEAAFEAQRLAVEPREGKRRHVSSPNRQYLIVASIFGRSDLIDHAVAMEDLGLQELRRPFESLPPGVTMDVGSVELTDEMRRRHHESSLPEWIEMQEDRKRQVLNHKADIERYQAIRDVVAQNPGIQQVDLTKHLPGTDNKNNTRLVDQLEAAGLLATATVGNRVMVWPAGQGNAAKGDRRRSPRWWFGSDPSITPDGMEPTEEWLNPEKWLERAQSLLKLLEEAASDSVADAGRRPTPLDFLDGMPASITATEGHLAHINEDRLSLAVWGHIETDAAVRILAKCIDEGHSVSARDRKKWLATVPRQTHVERIAQAVTSYDGTPRNLWILQEVSEPTEHSVAVTAVSASKPATRQEAACPGVILWR